ncbi:LrgB family protein [Virgibacillus chiguensis]|uniref:TIGR00659 family protein n=1 Tax=Virgibacillus chiguensis TaxID=411959 RepID=A0A1M5R494_9BACI|nr:LrgB family protein [Virgibacillus chiguensis]SHH21152.1 TIGR00659 family protein [Virgibacillus chiguensis]
MSEFVIAISAIIGTFFIYHLAIRIHRTWRYSLTAPVLVATILIISVLIIFRIPYETYMVGGKWINELLGPAVVALAYPLYKYKDTLKQVAAPILAGTLLGGVVGITTGLLLAQWAGFESAIVYSLTPKSVTTPVAMAVTDTIGGVMPLAAIFVMIAGIGGVLMHHYVFRLFQVNHYLGRGVGMGSASHAIGTATSMEVSQLEGAVSTISMVISAVVVSIITPSLVQLMM